MINSTQIPPEVRGSFLARAYHWLKNPYSVLDKAMHQCGLTFSLRLPIIGRAFITGEPRLLWAIMKNKNLIGGRGIAVLKPILGERSLISLEGIVHRRHRRIFTPPFRDTGMYDTITAETTQQFLQKLPQRQSFAIYDVVSEISLVIIVRLLFGDCTVERQRYLRTIVLQFLHCLGNPVLFARPLHIDLGKYNSWGRFWRIRQQLRQIIIDEIDKRRQRSDSSDLLGYFAGQAELDDDEIVTEIFTILMFGHDTAAATLAWAFYHIYSHPQVLAKITTEIDELQTQYSEIRPEHQRYLHACVEESMRLCPVVVHLTRVATCTTEIGGFSIAPGTRVLPCTYVAHHNPQVFVEPYQFRPERFLDESHEHAFFPFGFGPRKCIGMPFAMRQMKIILSHFIRDGGLELVPGQKIKPVRQLVLIVPSGGTQMRIG